MVLSCCLYAALLLASGDAARILRQKASPPTADVLAETDGASAALLEVDSPAVLGGNRGTGLSPGSWVVDGGLYWNGVNVDPTFKLFLRCRSISDSQLRGDALDTSLLLGERLPAGGYRNLVLTYARVKTGMFSSAKGYYLQRRLCTTSGTCMKKILVEEGQSKGMIYATLHGIEGWAKSGGSFRRSSAALAETDGA